MEIICRITKGSYKGREGYIKAGPNEFGLVMFYSKEGCYPYRTCIPYEDLEVING